MFLLLTITELEFEELQRLTVIMYQQTCKLSTCDEARRFLFTTRRGVENIPPTSDALFLQAKQSVLQASYTWSQSLVACSHKPNPSDWGKVTL